MSIFLQADFHHSSGSAKISCDVIIDSINTDENYAIGRTKYDAPEVDGQVIIGDAKERNLKVGEFTIVEITESTEYDLIAD